MATVRLIAHCPIDGKATQLFVDKEAFLKYQEGAFVQDAFPDYTPTLRETIKTGMCNSCQDTVFNDDED